MRSGLLLFALAAFACRDAGDCARVLGLFPHIGKSHYMVFQPLLRALAERGHQITTVSFFPLQNPPVNYTDVSLEGATALGFEMVDISDFDKTSPLMKVPILNTFILTKLQIAPVRHWALNTCEKILGLPSLAEPLKQEYDVVLMENFNSDCMLGLMHVYGTKAPIVGLSSCSIMPWTPVRFGLPDNPAYVPSLITPYTDIMTFKQRFETSFLNLYLKNWYHEEIQEKERAMIEKHFGTKIPDLEELGKKYSSLLLVNTFPTLNGVRPLVPAVVEVGGMHLDNVKKVIPSYSRRRCSDSARAMRINTVLVIISAVLIPHEVNSARILGLFPHPGKSHQMVFEPLLQSLAKRGHHVTTVSFFPLQNPPVNYTDVSLQNISQVQVETIDLSKFEAVSVLSKIPSLDRFVRLMFEFQPLANLGVGICDQLIKSQTLADVLRKEYDVVLLEIFNTDCMLGLLHVYKNTAPKIGLSSSNLMPWSPDRIGLTDNPSYIPVISIGLTPRMTITERLVNTFLNVFYKLWFYNAVQVKERSLIEKHFGSVIPDMTVLNKNYSLVMVNTFHTLNGIRPQLPASIEVGGMHLDKRRIPLPFYIEKFLNESEHGVILLSFGSLIKTATIPKYKEDIIVNTLSKLKQRVIWKYENSGEEGTLTGNILRVKWLPQYELLQHKKIVAFIAHGGLLGMTEAISAGKPMVVIPFFGDQPANAAAAAAVGFAKVVPYLELTENALSEALASVLSAESRLNARRMSSIWRDRQADPLETAVYWTERVIRWGNSAPLHSAARDMPLYQVALLDVIAVFLVVIVILVTLLWYSLSMVFRLLFGKESKLKMH